MKRLNLTSEKRKRTHYIYPFLFNDKNCILCMRALINKYI